MQTCFDVEGESGPGHTVMDREDFREKLNEREVRYSHRTGIRAGMTRLTRLTAANISRDIYLTQVRSFLNQRHQKAPKRRRGYG
jgi:hypothetical protein